MERLYAHKKSTFQFWDEQIQEHGKAAHHADPALLVASALEWLGVYSDQFPGITPADARCILYDWQTLWYYNHMGVLI